MSFKRGTQNDYESQKRNDWNTFCQYLNDHPPQVSLTDCNNGHVIEFLRSMDQFGTTKVHLKGCVLFGQFEPSTPCNCPLMQSFGRLNALVCRLKDAYGENVGSNVMNPFASGATKAFLGEVKEYQSAARGVTFDIKTGGEWRITDSYVELVFDPSLHYQITMCQ